MDLKEFYGMPHLVEPIKDVSLDECSIRLEACLDYLVKTGRKAAKRSIKVRSNFDWGAQMKRTFVELPKQGRPPDIGKPNPKQSLIEVINQTANILRMLDALSWIKSDQSGLNRHHVDVCHPTTSSAKGETDLVLSNDDFPTAKFEVTDVVGDKDGNNKEATDLKKLKFIASTTKKDNKPVPPPKYRGFLVMSEELAKVINGRNSWWSSGKTAVVSLESKQFDSNTVIFEIFPVTRANQ